MWYNFKNLGFFNQIERKSILCILFFWAKLGKPRFDIYVVYFLKGTGGSYEGISNTGRW